MPDFVVQKLDKTPREILELQLNDEIRGKGPARYWADTTNRRGCLVVVELRKQDENHIYVPAGPEFALSCANIEEAKAIMRKMADIWPSLML